MKFLRKYSDLGFFLLRLGTGALFIWHGWPKLIAGVGKWSQLGGAMQHLGIGAYPAVWGFLAAAIELGGGICLILGIFFRPACLLLLGVMSVAATMHLGRGDGIGGAAYALQNAFLFLGLLFVGPGRISIDKN
jgi:putative oxidoreductase